MNWQCIQIKTLVSNLVHGTRFWNNLHRVRPKPKYLNVFGSKKAKRSKQDSDNLLISPMHERGERYC